MTVCAAYVLAYAAVLNSGGRSIVTGLSSEEILEQLNLDYQDVYDYYGGAEELW